MQGIPKRSWPDVQPEAAEIPALHEALDLCLKAGEKRANCRAERFVLATAWLCADRYAEALRAYGEDDEDADSLCAMGQCYQYGTGVSQDDVLAVEYYRKAASMGHPQALYALGALYYVGDGDLEEDESEAVRHFALAAAQGHASAMYMLGDSLLDGIAGLQPDSDAAVRWLIAAGDKGHRGARSRVFALLAPRDDASPRQWDEKGFTDASRQTLRRRKTEQK